MWLKTDVFELTGFIGTNASFRFLLMNFIRRHFDRYISRRLDSSGAAQIAVLLGEFTGRNSARTQRKNYKEVV